MTWACSRVLASRTPSWATSSFSSRSWSTQDSWTEVDLVQSPARPSRSQCNKTYHSPLPRLADASFQWVSAKNVLSKRGDVFPQNYGIETDSQKKLFGMKISAHSFTNQIILFQYISLSVCLSVFLRLSRFSVPHVGPQMLFLRHLRNVEHKCYRICVCQTYRFRG